MIKAKIAKVLVILLFVNSKAIYAQSWLKYYSIINKAELAICIENFQLADSLYKDAFALNPTSWNSKNLYNSFLVALEVQDVRFAKKQFKALARRGLQRKVFERHILRLQKNGDDSLQMEQWYRQFCDTSLFNTHFNSGVLKLYRHDQGVRSYIANVSNGSSTDTVDKIDHRNQSELELLLNDFLPPLDSVSLNVDDAISDDYYNVIILHYLERNLEQSDSVKFLSTLYRGLSTYKTDPEAFASLLISVTVHQKIYLTDSICISEPLTFDGLSYEGKIYAPCMQESYRKRLNDLRAKFGLCSIEDVLSKLSWYNSPKNSNKYMIGPGPGLVYVTEKVETKEKWLAEDCLK